MTDNYDILITAINKAEQNGFNLFEQFGVYDFYYKEDKQAFVDDDYTYDGENEHYVVYKTVSLREVIFSHKFAKAFWGDHFIQERQIQYCLKNGIPQPEEKIFLMPSWKYNLKQMVLEKEPLKYLEKFL